MVYDLVTCTRYSKKRLHSVAYMLRVLWVNAERMDADHAATTFMSAASISVDSPQCRAKELTAASDRNLSSVGFDFGSVENVVTLCTCSYSTWENERTRLYCTIEMVP